MSADLVARLRAVQMAVLDPNRQAVDRASFLLGKAADEIERLTAELAAARESEAAARVEAEHWWGEASRG